MVLSSLDEIFEHNVKQSILKTYEAMLQYKFKVLQIEQKKEIKDELEVEIYTIIHTIEDLMSKKDLKKYCY